MPDRHDRFASLRELSRDLERADRAQALLDEIWNWCGPYGPEYRPTPKEKKVLETPEGQQILKAIRIPDELRYKLQDYYKFNDDE